MVWVNSIAELDFYRRGASDYCYCDLLIQPSDLTLQGIMGKRSQFNDLKIYLYTSDGKTQIADITSAFDWYIANIEGRSLFMARLKYFPEIMCDNRCFVLRATVGSRFDEYTQQYCLEDCCAAPSGVLISGPGVQTPIMQTTITSPKDATCRTLLRIQVAFDCVDRWTGDFWKVPGQSSYVNGSVAAGGMFKFTKVLNIAGTLLDQPWEITRSISSTICRVQRTESMRLYEVQSFEEFPLWKMQEISDMLHAPFLRINGRDYRYPGGLPFETLYPKKENKRYFRLKFPLQDCLQYQNFGCVDRCEGDNLKYYAFKTDSGLYYDDAGRPIGNFGELMRWFNTSGGGFQATATPGGEPGDITLPAGGDISIIGMRAAPPPEPWEVEVLGPVEVSIPYHEIIKVTGDRLPSYIYGGGTRTSDRIYAQDDPEGNYNGLFGLPPNHVACAIPVPGAPHFTDMICATPVTGLLTYTDECQTPMLGIPQYGDLDEPPPVSLTNYLLLEDGSLIESEPESTKHIILG